MKKTVQYFDDNNKENNPKKKRNVLSILPLPQLMNANKSPQSSQTLLDKMMKKSFVDKASSSNNVQSPISVSHEINVSHEKLKNKNYTIRKKAKFIQESSFSTGMHKSKSAVISSYWETNLP